MMIYYGKDNVMVRDSTETDIENIANNMRKSDMDEIWASHHHKPREALEKALKDSFMCLTVLRDNLPIAMFGLYVENIISTDANIWLLATDDLVKIQYKFLKHSRRFIEMFLKFYPHLSNFVDDRNTASIKWLKFCGAKMNGTCKYGIEQLPFHYFEFTRRNHVKTLSLLPV